jgi:hypothetical protein
MKAVSKGRGKVVPVHAKSAYQESGGTALLILNLGNRWAWVVKFTLRLLYHWE